MTQNPLSSGGNQEELVKLKNRWKKSFKLKKYRTLPFSLTKESQTTLNLKKLAGKYVIAVFENHCCN